MAKRNLLFGVVSCALHAVAIAVFLYMPSSPAGAPSLGEEPRAIEVFLSPGAERGEAPSAIVAGTVDRAAATTGAGEADLEAIRASAVVSSITEDPDASASAETHSAGGATAADYSAYRRRLLSHIRPYQFYPASGAAGGLNGVVQVGFAVRRNGTVLEVWVETSSGHSVLDAAAVETVRRAQPMPDIPAELPDTMDVLLPIGFALPARALNG